MRYLVLTMPGIVLAVSACSQREQTAVQPDLQRHHPIRYDPRDPIANLTDALDDELLELPLDELEAQLANVPPPPSTAAARRSAGIAADAVAVATVKQIGRREIDAVKDDLVDPAADLEEIDAIGKHTSAATTSEMEFDPGGTLLNEFLERVRLDLAPRLLDESDLLRRMRVSNSREFPHDFDAIEPELLTGRVDPPLSAWFKHKVTMAWMNLCSRVSLGPGLVAWNAGHGGMIDITVDVSFDTEGARLQVIAAKNEAGPGAAAVLRDARDDHGTPYMLATLPVYRRVWLKTGDSRLDITPAFVITPEGEIEANLDDDTLAAIAAGREGAAVPKADATIGAKLIVSMLLGVRTDEVQ